ncbi:hypothetical protein Godav_011793 [Gossypium davidsonii]|uniref:Uncharacterized protein n=1 Tax=Gossypium davidsonii TaxID=34287 RepID=A0A7J8RCJ5_GOSDV|nr:hypothetical protein [Gossypium davidsonii]
MLKYLLLLKIYNFYYTNSRKRIFNGHHTMI